MNGYAVKCVQHDVGGQGFKRVPKWEGHAPIVRSAVLAPGTSRQGYRLNAIAERKSLSAGEGHPFVHQQQAAQQVDIAVRGFGIYAQIACQLSHIEQFTLVVCQRLPQA